MTPAILGIRNASTSFSALADEGAAPTQSGDGATNGRTPDHEGTMSGFGRCETFDHDRRHRRRLRLIWRGAAAAKGVAASIFLTPRWTARDEWRAVHSPSIGIRNALLICAPFWFAVIWWWG